MIESQNPRRNHLLASLPANDWQRWQPLLEKVALLPGEVVHAPGQPPEHVYFPTDAIIVLTTLADAGWQVQTAVVGAEGMAGVSALVDDGKAPTRALVQGPGTAYRMLTEVLQSEVKRSVPVMHLMLRYTQALITQMSQTAACRQHHTLEQQLCTWLLLLGDRLSTARVAITHPMLASMLNVSLESVMAATQELQLGGHTVSVQGHTTVMDLQGLESRSCNCYRVVRKEYQRLLTDWDGQNLR